MKTRKDKDYSFWHTQQRMKERFGLDLTQEEYNRYNASIPSLRYSIISSERNSDDVQHFIRMNHRNRTVIFVYSENKQRITTVVKDRTK